MQLNAELIFEKTHIDAYSPKKAHKTDSGFDIYAPKTFSLVPGERRLIDTYLIFDIKLPFVFRVMNFFGAGIGIELQPRGKSGLAVKKGIEIFFGTIDESYRGNVKVLVSNMSNELVLFAEGDKICQIVPTIVMNRIKLSEGKVNTKTNRGSGGFGSTGER